MNRLESIKERMEKGHYIVSLESAYGTPYLDNGPEEDIEYLLQRLERYETALKRIETTNELVQAHFLANDALKDS